MPDKNLDIFAKPVSGDKSTNSKNLDLFAKPVKKKEDLEFPSPDGTFNSPRISANTNPSPEGGFGNRADGTPKGNGFLGILKRPDGSVSTELSIGVEMDGKEMEIPTLVPGLTEVEKNYLLSTPSDKLFTNDPNIFKGIKSKAVDHARRRISEGKSPFADNSESLQSENIPDGTIQNVSNSSIPQSPDSNTWASDMVDQMTKVDPNTPGYFTKLAQGNAKALTGRFSYFFRKLDDVQELVARTVGRTIFGKEGESAREAIADNLPIPSRPFKAAADAIDWANKGAADAPDDFIGNVSTGVSSIVPDIVVAHYLLPEVAVSGWLAKYGIKSVDKFTMLLGGEGIVEGMTNPNAKTPIEQMTAPVVQGAIGTTQGLLYNSMGVVSENIGKTIAGKIFGKTNLKELLNRSLMQSSTSVLSNALLFGGYTGLDDAARKITELGFKEGIKNIDWKAVETSIGVGAALGIRNVGKLAFVRGMMSFASTPTKQVNEVLKSKPTAEEMKVVSDEALEKLNETIGKIKQVEPIDQAELNKNILEAQKRLGLPEEPDVQISPNTMETLGKLRNGEPVTNDQLSNASNELYGIYKGLRGIRESPGRKYTTDQIEKKVTALGSIVETLENTKQIQAENEEFIADSDREIVRAVVNDNLSNLKAFSEEVISNPEKVIKAVNESSLPDGAKRDMVDKINQVAVDNDPLNEKVKPITDQIDKLTEELAKVEKSSEHPSVKKIKADKVRGQIKEEEVKLQEIIEQAPDNPITSEEKLIDTPSGTESAAPPEPVPGKADMKDNAPSITDKTADVQPEISPTNVKVEVQELQDVTSKKPTYITSSGQKIYHDGNEIRVIREDGSEIPQKLDRTLTKKPKKGKPQPPTKYKVTNPEYQKAVTEYIESVDLDKGESAFNDGEQYPDNLDIAEHIANYSNNPREIAESYLDEITRQPYVEGNAKDEAINNNIGFVVGGEKTNSPGSFRNVNDISNITPGMRLNWFRENGTTLDEVARLASGEFGDGSDIITPNDVAEFIIKYPNNGDYLRKNKNPNLAALKERFEYVTGLPLDDAMIKRVRNEMLNKLAKAEQLTPNEIESFVELPQTLIDIIKHEGLNINNIEQFRDNSFIFDPGEYEKVKQYLETQSSNPGPDTRYEIPKSVETLGQRDGGEQIGFLETESRRRIEEIDAEIANQQQLKQVKINQLNNNIELPIDTGFGVQDEAQTAINRATKKYDDKITLLQRERDKLIQSGSERAAADRAQGNLFSQSSSSTVESPKTVEQLQTELAQGKWKGNMAEYSKEMEKARKRASNELLNDNELSGSGTEFSKRQKKSKETGMGRPITQQGEPKGARAKDWIDEDKMTNDQLGNIEFPELVALVKELTGFTPIIRYLGRALGRFQYTEGGTGRIKLARELFKEGNERELGKVIAHEIGHLVDWLPDKTMKRGNLLGRLASLKNHYKSLLKETPSAIDNILTDKDRIRIRREAEAELKAEYNKGIREVIEDVTKEVPVYEETNLSADDILSIWRDTTGEKKYPDLYEYIARASAATKKSIVAQALKGIVDEAIKGKFGKRLGTKTVTERVKRIIYPKEISSKTIHERFRQLLIDEINRRRLFDLITIKDELKKLTKWWNPFDEKSDAEYTKYRHSGKELYAEAISVLLNMPQELAARAPWFNRAFFNHLESKPEVKDAYESLQELIKNPDKVFEERSARALEGYKEAREKVIKESDRSRRHLTVDNFVRTFVSEISPLIKKLPNTAKYGELSIRQKVRNLVEQMKFINNKYAEIIYSVKDDVLAPLEKIGMDSDEFGMLLEFGRNTSKTKLNKPAPGGMQPEYSAKQIQHIRSKYTPEQQTVIDEALNKFHDIAWNVLEEANKAGVYSDEMMQKVFAPNKDTYATFQAVEYATNYVSSAIHELKGSLKQIRNPLESTMAKLFAISNTTYRNRAASAIVESLRDFVPEEIEEAKPDIRNGVHIGQFKPVRNKYALGYYDQGVYKGVYVDPYFEGVFRNHTPQEIDYLTSIFRGFNKGFKPLVTSWNPGFAFLFNVIKDSRRSVTNLTATASKRTIDPKVWASVRLNMLKGFAKSAREGADLYEGKMSEVIKEMMDAGVFDYRTGILSRYNEGNAESIDAIASRIGMGNNVMTPWETKLAKNKVARELNKLAGWYFKWGAALEIGTKINAYKYLRGHGFSKDAAAFNVRNYVGTPNYKEGGRISKNVNEYLPFSTVIIQGLRNDFSLATKPQTAGAYWFDMVMGAAIPAMGMALAGVGAFGDDVKKLIGNIPTYYRYNYLSIPLGKSETGKTQYLSIPMDEVSRLIYATSYGLTKAIAESEMPTMKEVQQLGQIGIGFIPSLSPLANIVGAWNDYLVKGKNPSDDFRGGNVIKQKHFNARGWPATKDMLSWSLSRSGGSGIMSLFSFDPIENTTKEFMVKNIPIISRIYRESSAGDGEIFRQINEQEKQKSGKKIYEQDNIIDNIVRQYFSDCESEKKDEKLPFIEYSKQMAQEYFGHFPLTTTDELNEYRKMNQKLKLKIIGGIKGDHQQIVNAIINSYNNNSTVAMLKKYKETHSDAEYAAVIKYIRSNKIVSDNVLAQVK